jgi:ribosomal protein S18 acetylase RimI-like enzyme
MAAGRSESGAFGAFGKDTVMCMTHPADRNLLQDLMREAGTNPFIVLDALEFEKGVVDSVKHPSLVAYHTYDVDRDGSEVIGGYAVVKLYCDGGAKIVDLGVLPAFRRRGYGRALIESLQAFLQHCGGRGHVSWYPPTDQVNLGTVSFLDGLGFKIDKGICAPCFSIASTHRKQPHMPCTPDHFVDWMNGHAYGADECDWCEKQLQVES